MKPAAAAIQHDAIFRFRLACRNVHEQIIATTTSPWDNDLHRVRNIKQDVALLPTVKDVRMLNERIFVAAESSANEVVLKASTGVPTVDDTLRTIVKLFEQAFPDRVRSCYLVGSYVERTAVPLSDLDCCIVFKHQFESPHEQTATQQMRKQCSTLSSVRLDLVVHPEGTLDQLYPFFQVALKLGSLLIYGADFRENISLPTFSAYSADAMAGAYHFIARLRGETQLSTSLVAYPDSADEFFGYIHKSIADWYPPTILAGTKELVATVSRIATAMIVQHSHQYVPGKQHAVQLFQQYVGGPWAPFVEQVFERCKHEWKYLIPEVDEDRSKLQQLCQQMLAFENAFLQMYHEHRSLTQA